MAHHEGDVEYASRPTHFYIEKIPETTYLVIPEVSSEKREYVPIGFMGPDTFASNLVKVMPNASLYHFAVLTSRMHMTWMRYVCGRMKSDYRYSVGIVYNTFPWPEVTDEQKKKVESTAQMVIDARANHSAKSFALLYDPLTMPEDLYKAHKNLDKAVDSLYCQEGFKDDDERILLLFSLYNKRAGLKNGSS